MFLLTPRSNHQKKNTHTQTQPKLSRGKVRIVEKRVKPTIQQPQTATTTKTRQNKNQTFLDPPRSITKTYRASRATSACVTPRKTTKTYRASRATSGCVRTPPPIYTPSHPTCTALERKGVHFELLLDAIEARARRRAPRHLVVNAHAPSSSWLKYGQGQESKHVIDVVRRRKRRQGNRTGEQHTKKKRRASVFVKEKKKRQGQKTKTNNFDFVKKQKQR